MKKLLNQPQRILALCLLIFVTSTQLFAQCGVGNLYSSRTLPANSGVMVSLAELVIMLENIPHGQKQRHRHKRTMW